MARTSDLAEQTGGLGQPPYAHESAVFEEELRTDVENIDELFKEALSMPVVPDIPLVEVPWRQFLEDERWSSLFDELFQVLYLGLPERNEDQIAIREHERAEGKFEFGMKERGPPLEPEDIDVEMASAWVAACCYTGMSEEEHGLGAAARAHMPKGMSEDELPEMFRDPVSKSGSIFLFGNHSAHTDGERRGLDRVGG